MFFQINITPKEKKSKEPLNKEPISNKYNLLLAPFQPPTKIKLDTCINVPVECQLTIINTNNRSLTASITKIPPQERCIKLSTTEWSIQPESSVELNITWEPQEGGTWRDILQLSDSRRIKYDIPITLTCVDPNKNSKEASKNKKKNVLGSKVSRKTIIQKSSSVSQKPVTSNQSKPALNAKDKSVLKKNTLVATGFSDKENISNNVGFNWMLEQVKSKKLKNGQLPPALPTQLDFSRFLDSSAFKFTPLKSKLESIESNTIHDNIAFNSKNNIGKTDESLLFKEESITVKSKVQMTLRKETYIKIPQLVLPSSPSNLNNEETDNFDDSLSPKPLTTEIQIEKPQSEISMLFNEIKFTPFKNQTTNVDQKMTFSPNYCSTGCNKSDKNKSFNEDLLQNTGKNATFEINSPDDSKDNVTYELPKSPRSSKNNTQLKPTCLAKAFDKNHIDISFSTPLPVKHPVVHVTNDITRYSNQFSKSQIDVGSAKDCLEANLWVKSRNTSLSPISKSIMHSTLESIEEEYTHPNDHKEKLNILQSCKEGIEEKKGFCIEISPPQKNTIKKTPIRKVSPTKYSKIIKEKTIANTVNAKKKLQINKSIKDNQSIQIPGVKIAKLSLTRLIRDKDKSNNKFNNKQNKEVSVKLHDPNDFLRLFCNPDPFAATMTHDPFMANSLYYDDKWIFVQELEFKKWLNALLTPPEHLTADVESAPIDIGKVWQSCRSKEAITLAETKESISARYHTNTRLNALRKAACAMYRKPEVIKALSQTTVCIEKEILVVRADKDLHRDIGLQKIILELFISYNPLWLRIGLETIYGETIPLQSNNDLVGLSRFLFYRFFSDPFLVKTHSSHAHPNIRLKSFQALMNKFMLKKFVFLVYFLDYAKNNKLIGHDPCLFHKKALIKESKSILLTFSREVLSGIGDITKVLRNYNYVVSHKQNYLDEYDYAVVNLCSDLRDGVRLCRVMELITGNRCLTCLCRVPAISRLQKIHNVNIALNTLKEAGYTIIGGIDAKSIADGHKEKTMSLLWQIIYKFQAPRFEKAAKTLQRWWRSKMWYVSVKKMLRNRKNDAASVLQRSWKCFKARQNLEKLKEEYSCQMQIKSAAAGKIQMYWKLRKMARQQQQEFQYIKFSVIKIQNWWRRIIITKPYVVQLKKEKQLVLKMQRYWRAKQLMIEERNSFLQLKSKAVQVQRLWRARRVGKQVFADYQKTRASITTIQNKWRAKLLMRKERQLYLQKYKAIKFIQQWWRRCLVLKKDRNYFVALKKSVGVVEKVWIAKHTVTEERKSFIRQKRSAEIIKRAWKVYRDTKQDVSIYKMKKNSSLKIQSWWRSVATKKNYLRQRSSIVTIQKWWNSVRLTKKEQSDFLALKSAALVLQKNWRMKLAKKEFRSKKDSVLKIEIWYVNLVKTRTTRNEYLKMKAAIKTIENRWTAVKLGRLARTEYLKCRYAAIILQRRWRAQILMKQTREKFLEMNDSMTKIQSWWKMICERRRFKELVRQNRAATILQQRWRALKRGREAREMYDKYRSSALCIQRKYRATLLARAERRKFLKKRASAIVVQKYWRAFAVFREYKRVKNAVRIIEEWRKHIVRGRNARMEFLKLKACAAKLGLIWRAKRELRKRQEAAIVIQKYWRSRVLLKEYKKKKRAVIVIQRWRRNILLGRKVRAEYRALTDNVIKVQRKWRTLRQMREYKKLREAAITLQKNWKRYSALKEFRKKIAATRTIQSWWRNLLLAKRKREEFVKYRACTVKVQSRWRAVRQIREFRRQREAAITIQKYWRRTVAMKDFDRKKIAVLFIEDWRKHVLFGREVKFEYLKLRMTTIRVQHMFRVKLLVKEFQKKRRAAKKIQCFWRSVLKMRECKVSYQRQKAAAVLLQRRYRANRLALQVRANYCRTVLATTKIQRWWKNILYRQELKWAVAVIENWWIDSSEERRVREIRKAKLKRIFGAAVKIQAVWRGFKVRQTASKQMKILRERAKQATKAAVPSASLAFRLQENIEIFKYATNIGQLSVCLSSLDVITRLLPNACVNVCQLNLVPKLYDILTRANRSLPWLDVCLKDISILLTLAKFKQTIAYVLKEEYIEVLARLLTISVDKNEELFLHTATLIWVLTENNDYAEAVKSCPRTKYLLHSLYTSIDKKLSRALPNTTKLKGEFLPSLKPDWGLSYKRPRTFGSVTQAITSLASR